ncbi:UNKNOWN [Stylonychia lemnae]|uniref:CS domain-containing protein n=1 Tax=Stylonychia lemnae TaxID=5949 RepID=A0A078AT63_STYLE|nr:UNKNOWN [Stylonychia lemnae]|eukprot:CDW85645.1 UNKNOWN [Stylonychia lemnae]
MNYFNTTKNQIQKVELEKLPIVLDYMRQGMALVNERMEKLQAYVTKQKDYLIVETPVQWAQSLNHVFVELRYAHRHDAPGCSNADDEQIELTEDTLSLSVLCMEVNTKVKYMIKINLWDKIDVNKSSYEYQAVGRQHFTLAKLNAPARWRTLYQEVNETQQALDKITRNSGKPFQIRLWLQRHEKHVQQLWEFEGDAIDDYEGHQWMEEKNEEYEDYIHKKSLSKKGPIPLKKKKKNKSKKSKK